MSNGFEYSSPSSGGGILVGSLVPIADTPSPIYTSGGQDYLRTGVLAPISIYAGLEYTNTYLTANVGTNANNTNSSTSKEGFYTNGYYYFTDNAGTGAYSTNLSTFAAVATQAVSDAFVMGNYLIGIESASATGTYTLGPTPTSMSVATGMTCGASNAAGTLAVVVKSSANGAGNVYTSTNAITWTSQTVSGGGGSTVYRAVWSIAASKFIYLAVGGNILLTSNGYTLSAGGVTGVTSITSVVSGLPSSHSASSATTTMITGIGTVGGIVGPFLLKTADGTSVTTTLISTLLGLDSRQQIAIPPRISYGNGTWLLILSPLSGDSVTSLCYKSIDEGVTWTKIAIPANSSYAATAVSFFKYLNNAYVSGLTGAGICRVGAHTNSLSATHVGIAQKSDNVTSGGAAIPNYVRIR